MRLKISTLVFVCAAAGSSQPPPLEGIAHVSYRVRDVQKTDAYYTGVLGLPLAFHTKDGARNMTHAPFTLAL